MKDTIPNRRGSAGRRRVAKGAFHSKFKRTQVLISIFTIQSLHLPRFTQGFQIHNRSYSCRTIDLVSRYVSIR